MPPLKGVAGISRPQQNVEHSGMVWFVQEEDRQDI